MVERKECPTCNHYPVCKEELKQSFATYCPFNEQGDSRAGWRSVDVEIPKTPKQNKNERYWTWMGYGDVWETFAPPKQWKKIGIKWWKPFYRPAPPEA